MSKMLWWFFLGWMLLIVTFVTGAALLYFVESMGGIAYLFPIIMLALYVIKEVKAYTDNSRRKD